MARRKPANYRRLLEIDTNAKTVKGQKRGYLTAIMYLAPHDSAGLGYSVCPKASPGCIAGCLNLSGLGGVYRSIQDARKAKTLFMAEDPEAFLASLRYDIESLVIRARKRRLRPAVRINGTSDLPKHAMRMAREFPKVMFYDYTKLDRAWTRQLPNYRLTFSRSESNDTQCREALARGVNVAVVFATKDLPETFFGRPVLNGDESDLRFLDPTDPQGYVIGLYAKGPAKKDLSGFVVRQELVQLLPLAKAA